MRKVSDQQEDHQLRPADGIFVQSRRLHDVLHLRGDVDDRGTIAVAVPWHDVAGLDRELAEPRWRSLMFAGSFSRSIAASTRERDQFCRLFAIGAPVPRFGDNEMVPPEAHRRWLGGLL